MGCKLKLAESKDGVFMIRITGLIYILFLLLIPVNASALPKVLLIESYHAEYLWDQEMMKGLESSTKGKIELLRFQMDTKRLHEDVYEERAELAWQYYREVKPDVVILADDNALKYVGSRLSNTDTPVVYMGINENPRNYLSQKMNITGVLERPLYKRTIKYINEILYVGNDKVLILFDNGTTTQAFKKQVFKESDSLTVSGVKTDLKVVSKFDKWKKTIEEAESAGYRAIVVGLYQRVFDDGKHVDSEELLEWTSANSGIPVFAFWRMSVGKGKAVGGMVLCGEEQGRAAGNMVLEILEGKPTNRISPVTPDRGRFVFSRSELARWKIRLPYKIMKQSFFVP